MPTTGMLKSSTGAPVGATNNQIPPLKLVDPTVAPVGATNEQIPPPSTTKPVFDPKESFEAQSHDNLSKSFDDVKDVNDKKLMTPQPSQKRVTQSQRPG